MYGLRRKLVCLFKLACLSKPKDTNLLQNLSIYRKLRNCNALLYRPLSSLRSAITDSSLVKLYLTGQNLDQTYNFKSACLHALHLFFYEAKLASLELKVHKLVDYFTELKWWCHVPTYFTC